MIRRYRSVTGALVAGIALHGGIAWSAISFVKASTQAACSNVASCASSFASLPASSNVVAVGVSCWNASADCAVSSVTDNQGNTYSLDCSTDTNGNSQTCIALDVSIGSPSGTFTVTANAAAATYFQIIAAEYVVSSASKDVVKAANAASGTADTGTSTSTVQADELALCVMAQSSSDTNINVTTPSGYTRRGVNQDASSTVGFEFSDKILTSAGTQQCAWTHDTVGQAGWAAQLVTVRPASSGSGGMIRRAYQ